MLILNLTPIRRNFLRKEFIFATYRDIVVHDLHSTYETCTSLYRSAAQIDLNYN